MPSMVVPIIRLIVLSVTTIFSIIVMAVSANLITQTEQYLNVIATFCILGVVTGGVSLVTVPVMIIVDILRRGAFTSMIVVELIWLSILWVLWIATAGETAHTAGLIMPDGCIYANPIVNGMCQETQVVEAFSFLNFIILLIYTGVVLVMALIGANRGEGVWTSSVKESFGPQAGPVGHPMAQYNTSVPPQPHYTTGPTQNTPSGVAIA